MTQVHGRPVWFELATEGGQLPAAGKFYAEVLGWTVQDSGMEGFTYHLATSGGDMVAGLMEKPAPMAQVPPNWLIYFGVTDVDKTAADITAAGGSIFREPADIPGTGRFAVVSDPQGTAFGILQPLPMQAGEGGQAFCQSKAGHGNWVELMSSDDKAGFAFYSGLFGWQAGDALDMGDMGTYQLFRHDGAEIGGMMGVAPSQPAAWLPYFGVNGVNPAIQRVTDAGGKIFHGPQEVPGGAFIAIGTDPQGATFAVVGPLERVD